MNKSETISELAKALSKAQAELKPAPKTADNPFFKSKYADLATVMDVARPVLAKNGLAVTQVNRANGMDSIIVETVLMHESGEWISGELELPLTKHDAQGVGSTYTYGRRYGLSAILGIVADEDDDGNAASNGKPQPKQPSNEKGKSYQAACQSLATTYVKAGKFTSEDIVSEFIPAGKKKFAELTDAEAFEAYKKMTEGM